MKILRLAQARVLLWARDREGAEPFEVSRGVTRPADVRCPCAPHCPGEPMPAQEAWIASNAAPAPGCPYGFESRGACLRHHNRRILEAALFGPAETGRARRLLEALGYRVDPEPIDPSCGPPRILRAHGFIGPKHEVRLIRNPALGTIILVREHTGRADARWNRPHIRVHPAGEPR